MAEPTVEDIAGWLKENPDQEGTSDYVHMASAYKALRAQQKGTNAPLPPTKTWSEDMWGRAKLAFGMKPGDIADAGEASRGIADWWNDKPAESKPVPGAENVPNLEDIMTAKRLTSDPRSLENRANRVMAQTVGGIPDLGIGLYNAGARTIGSPESQFNYVTPQMTANAGAPELPPDAPWYERMGEAGASAFLGGGAGAAGGALQTARATAATTGAALPVASTVARMAVPTVVPTVAGDVAGQAGGYLGEKYLGDRETGALLASLLGGSIHAAPQAGRSLIHQWYASDARPDAPQIAAAARRQGVTPTAGMVGNDSILRREQQLSGMPGSADVVQNARTNARNQIGAAYDASAAARGAVDLQPTAGTIGEKINTAARESAEALRGVSDQRQIRLNERIPQDTPTHLLPIQERGYGMMTDPNARIGPTERAAIDFRVTEQLNPLASRDAGGQPIQVPVQGGPPGIGHNGGPPLGPTTQVAPYGDVAGFRTELGRSVDTPAGGRMPPVSALYEPTTQVMREAAQRAGVDPRDFNTTQNATRDIMRETPAQPGGPPGDYHALLNYVKENPEAAFNYLNGKGRQDPSIPGILDATGHRGIGEIFGDIMRLIGNETINSPQTNPSGGARGPANLVNALQPMHPDSRATILGDQLPNVSDQALLAQRLNVPTSQAGLTRSVGGQGNSVANKVLGSEALAQLGGHYAGPIGAVIGRVIGMLAPSDLRARRAGVMEGPTALNALSGGVSPSGINELAAAMTAAAAQQQQRSPLQITVHPESRP
jgi:hypothetical protein